MATRRCGWIKRGFYANDIHQHRREGNVHKWRPTIFKDFGPYLPCPWLLPSNVRFGGVILDPPTYPKIGLQLWTFPNAIMICDVLKSRSIQQVLFSGTNCTNDSHYVQKLLKILKLNYAWNKNEIELLWCPLFLGATSFSSQYSNMPHLYHF